MGELHQHQPDAAGTHPDTAGDSVGDDSVACDPLAALTETPLEASEPIGPPSVAVCSFLTEMMAANLLATATPSENMPVIGINRFETLFHNLPIACLCFDQQGKIREWNQTCETLHNKRITDVFGRLFWDVIGRPADRDIHHALALAVLSGERIEGFEWEDVTDNGAVHHFLSYGFPLQAPGHGEIVGGISTHIDITDRKRMLQALYESDERWQLAVRGSNDAVWDWNIRTGDVFYAERWGEILGEPPQKIGTTLATWQERIHPDDTAATLAAFQQHLERQSDFYESEHRLRRGDGSYIWVAHRGQALWDRRQELVRMAGSVTDITQRKETEEQLKALNRRLEELANCDGLTGLKNHRAFQEHLESEAAHARRHQAVFSLVFLDVDHFKQYNDTFGHPAGDDVLRRVAGCLSAGARGTDVVARYGGEEFAVILRSTSEKGARAVAERLRKLISEEDWPQGSLTASFGVSTWTPGTENGADLIAQADRALYAAKAEGRNRVRHFHDIRHEKTALQLVA